MPVDPCPSASELEAFHRGLGLPESLEAVGTHVATCPTCEQLLQGLDSDLDSLVVRLRDAAERDPFREFAEPSLEGTFRANRRETPNPRESIDEDVSNITTRFDDRPDADSRRERSATFRRFGDYLLMEEIGHGGMGVVYHARQLSLNRSVAVKLIRTGIMPEGTDDLRRFRTEAEAVALLDHPGIVPIFETGSHDGRSYLCMKYIEGSNLSTLLESYRSAPMAAASLMVEVAEAVHYAHQRGVLHRDLKPANILVDRQGRPHVTDFGLAKLIGSGEDLTASGAILGTPSSMSPEQALGLRGGVTTATDVYGLGAILYALLTGRAPFEEGDMIATLAAVRTALPARPTTLNPTVPRDLELICLKCLEKAPADRYASAEALAVDLRRFVAGESVSVRRSGLIEVGAKWARRKPTLAAAYALGLLAVTLGGLGAVAATAWMNAEEARSSADAARADADRNRLAAESARSQALAAGDAARILQDRSERAEYGRTMEVAYQEYRENRLAAARSLIEGTRADLRGWEWNYLDRLCHAEQVTLRAGSVMSFAAFSPDGRRIATACRGGKSYVWDAADGRKLLDLDGPDSPYWIGFSPDGTRIVARFATNPTLAQGRVLVWDAATGAVILEEPDTFDDRYPFHGSPLSHDGSRIAVSYRDPNRVTIRESARKMTHGVWDLTAGRMPLWLGRHDGGVLSTAFSADGRRVLTGGRSSPAKVWDARTGADLLTLETGELPVHAVFCPDGRRILTSINHPRLWDASTGEEIRSLRPPELWHAVFSPEGTRVAGEIGDNQAVVCDLDVATDPVILKGHTAPITHVSFSPDGKSVLTASEDQTARLWDASTGRELRILRGHIRPVTSARFSPDGERILTSGAEGEARLWDADLGDPEALVVGGAPGNSDIDRAVFSPDGTRILTSGQYGRVWETRSSAQHVQLKGWDNFLNRAAFFPDGRHAIAGIRNYRAAVWDTETGDLRCFLGDHAESVQGAAVSRNGRYIATAGDDKTIRLYDGVTGTFLRALLGHTGAVKSVEFSPDDTRLLTAAHDGTARIWDVAAGAELSVFPSESTALESARFSRDGRRIVTTGLAQDARNWTARVWDVATGERIHSLRGLAGAAVAASFSPDGSRIVTAGSDRQVKIWDAAAGVEVLSLKGHTGEVHSAEFSPDGTRIVSAGRDGSARIWDSTPLHSEILARRPAPPAPSAPAGLDSRLPAILRGTARPAHFAEQLTCAQLAYDTRRYAAATRLWEEVLEANPDLGRVVHHRYNLARAAVLAASGAGDDEAPPGEAAKSSYRTRAHALLRTELDELSVAIPKTPPEFLGQFVGYLAAWTKEPALSSVRDPKHLGELPAAEKAEWQALWADVDSLLAKSKDPRPR